MTVDLARIHNLAQAMREVSAKTAPHAGQPAPLLGIARSWFRIENAASPQSADVYLYDTIGDWGVTAQDFVNELRTITSPSMALHVNCYGGEIFDGLAIYESLRQHASKVTAYVDGVAASAASFIVQAADTRVMGRNARMMIHDGHGLVLGNAADMREMASLLDDLSDNIASIYQDRAGAGTVSSWRDAMRAGSAMGDGTWYDAQAAVDAGLADEVTPPPGGAANVVVTPASAAPAAAWNPGAFLATLRDAERPPAPPLQWDPQEFLKTIKEVAP